MEEGALAGACADWLRRQPRRAQADGASLCAERDFVSACAAEPNRVRTRATSSTSECNRQRRRVLRAGGPHRARRGGEEEEGRPVVLIEGHAGEASERPGSEQQNTPRRSTRR
eukprot:scaffold11571_cov119-Isochrysis_galbana.AAC.3